MARNTSRGLHVWDLGNDPYVHSELAANWDLVDSYWIGFDSTSKLPKRLHTTATVPGSATAGDVVMLTAADGGFSAWQLIRYDGSAWRPVGYEILPAVPSSGNFAGRVVVLSSSSGSFNAWDVIRYDGTTWSIVGGLAQVNTGAGATNIQGLQTAKDIYINDSARGFIGVDRVTGTKYRLFISNGAIYTESVT